MKRMILGLALLGLMATASMAGQGIGVGGSSVDGLFGPILKHDWMFSKHFGVECRASYLSGSQDMEVVSKEDHFQSGQHVRSSTMTTSGDMDVTTIPLEAALKMVYPYEKWTPYMLLGGGYYIYDADIATIGGQDASAENVFGFFGAVGVELTLKGNMVLFAEVQYTKATWESEEDYSGSRREWAGMFRYADYDYTGTQTVKGGLDGVGGDLGLLWKF